MNEDNNLQTVLDAGRALGTPITADSAQAVLVIPGNHSALAFEKLIEPYLPAPRRLKQNVALADSDSFIRYVGDFKGLDTRIFANVPPNNGAPSFLAIIDYHAAQVASDQPGGTGARWGEHRATLDCAFTEEWRRWTGHNAKRMSQADFATFLEENQNLLVEPSGADLLELISTLEGHNNVNVNQAIKLSNGKFRMSWEEDVSLTGKVSGSGKEEKLDTPQVIKTKIQMFEGGVAYVFDNRLRYRIENRRLTFWYDAVDLHLIIKDGVKDVVAAIEEKLKIKPLFGAPQ